MPEQLFRFASDSRSLLIGAANEVEARGMLQAYLKRHPLLPSFTCWRLKEICGKVDYGIFTIRGQQTAR
jgi:hypothetical protein